MESLPLELIEQICSLLCDHCQHRGTFPDASSSSSSTKKTKTLAHLCLVSRRVRSVAQPFLFHHYATGNLPPESDSGTRGHARDLPDEDDKLPVFLRSIILRPDLAAHVKTLQLAETDEMDGCTPDVTTLLLAAARRVGASHHAPTEELLRTRARRRHDRSDAARRVQRLNVHHWLEELAILLLPNVEMLLVARDSFCQYEHIRDSGASLPALKAVSLRGVSRNQHVHEAAALFAAAPNLETLRCSPCSLFDGLSPWARSRPWTLRLGGLRRLAVGEIGFEDLGLLVGCCPGLRELDVTAINIHRTAGVDYWDMSKLLRTLEPVRRQLRKLRLTHAPSRRERKPTTGDASWSFRGFHELEEVTFDQTAIDCRSKPSAPVGNDDGLSDWGLVELFPPSIRSVHFLHARDDLMEHLKRLARGAGCWLPELSLVRLTPLDVDGIGKTDFGLHGTESIKSAFDSAGISLRWSSGHSLARSIPSGVSKEKTIDAAAAAVAAGMKQLAL